MFGQRTIMKWNIERFWRKGKLYYAYKAGYREKGKVKTKRVYLGPEKRATKILADFNAKKPDHEHVYSYTGEILLKTAAQHLKFSQIIEKHVERKASWSVGDFFQLLVIERCLNPISKWALAQRIHKESIFALENSIPAEAFSEANIYHYMDYIHPAIKLIQADLIEQVYKLFPAQEEVLLLDGTSLYTHGKDSDPASDKEAKEEENAEEGVIESLEQQEPEQKKNGKPISRRYGYSRSKRPDLCQVNVMLGVNQRQIPLYFEVFAGNTTDLTMFEYTLQQLNTSYQGLLKRMKRRYMIFDRGNACPVTMQQLDQLCDKWQFHFIGGAKSCMFKQELADMDNNRLTLLFQKDETELHGYIIEKTVYGRKRKILLYTSKAVRKHKLLKFNATLEMIQALLAEIEDNVHLSPSEKVTKMKSLLRKYSMVQMFFLQKFLPDGTPVPCFEPISALYTLVEAKVEAKKARLGDKSVAFQEQLTKVQGLLAGIEAQGQLSSLEKSKEIKAILRKHSMTRLFLLKKFTKTGEPEISGVELSKLYRILPQKVEAKKAVLGKFVLFSNDLELNASEMMRLYKTQEVVEHEFHLLKGVLQMEPFRHWLPSRIDTHMAIVCWGMLFLSILKNLLEQHGLSYSFEELLRVIKHGQLQKVIFLYSDFKNFQLTRTVGFTPALEQIYRFLGLRVQPFHIEELSQHFDSMNFN